MNYAEGSTIFINPDVPIARKMRDWYDSLPSKRDIKTVTFDPAKKCMETKSAKDLLLIESKIGI